MDSADALDILKRHEAALRQLGARHAALFGSTVTGKAHAGSDVDILVDLDNSTVRTLFDYVGVIHFIEDLFPTAVDVANRATLKAHVRPDAERDAVYAF